MTKAPLPIDPHLGEIRGHLDRRRAVVVVAPPGAGKTTRVPPALAGDGAVIVLQPRRVAARSLARRIADENGWSPGAEVGWQVRYDSRFSSRTRILVATEGILNARLQSDPLLSEFRTVILDEFHERTVHADLALAMGRQAWLARSDLRLVVMSATLDAEPVARFLDDAPVVRVEGRSFPVEVVEEPAMSLDEAVVAASSAGGRGHVLVFLPGAGEIRRAATSLAARRELAGMRVLPLHGRLAADEQDAAIAPSPERKVILATNVAETSLTVDGVTAVVDTGLHRVVRYDAAIGIDRLETERISRDSADQRTGRAGRTAPGIALRLWDPRDHLRAHREPEIERVDLSGPMLDVLRWGGSPGAFAWFEPPPAGRVEAALEVLEAIGAARGGRITPLGAALRELALPPRLARVLAGAGGGRLAAAACAVLGESFEPRGPLPAASSDLLARADRIREAPPGVRQAAEEFARATERLFASNFGPALASARIAEPDEETRVLRALLAAFPDRLARRRAPGSPRLVLASGHGAVLDRASVVHEGEILLALDVAAGARGPGSEARVRVASRVERAWLPAAEARVEHRYDAASRSVRAVRAERVGGLTLAEHAVAAEPEASFPLLVEAYTARGVTPDQAVAAARMRFAGIALDLRALAATACRGRTSLPPLEIERVLPAAARHTLEKLAPASIPLPSGRTARLDYRDDGTVVAAVKLQELFGLAESPRVGAQGARVVFELLAPNGRPVQTTRDLRSFWETGYPEVRRELRGRYPRHPWPDDPWTAPPTHRVKPR